MTPANADGMSHADAAAAFEDRAETALKDAATCIVGDPEGMELLADAHASALLALSHRTAEQTALLSGTDLTDRLAAEFRSVIEAQR